MLYREQTLLREVLGEVRRLMPFELLGFDTDNDTAFLGTSQGVGLDPAHRAVVGEVDAEPVGCGETDHIQVGLQGRAGMDRERRG